MMDRGIITIIIHGEIIMIIIIGRGKKNSDDLDKALDNIKKKFSSFFSKGPKSFIIAFLVSYFFYG